MSYQSQSNRRYIDSPEQDYRNLDEERKQKIMKELQEEMDKLKVKYMLDEKDKKVSKINDLDSLIMSGREDKRQMLEKDDSLLEEELEEKDEQEENNEEPIEEINEKENLNELKYEKFVPKSKYFKELEISQKSNQYKKSSNENSANYEIFDKAKENLLKIKNQLDDMDQYDYRNRKENFSNSLRDSGYNENKDVYLNEYLEEERPKNLEVEMSMSMSKSIREDSLYNSQSNSQYQLNAPNISSQSYNFVPLQVNHSDLELKRQRNNYMPVQQQSRDTILNSSRGRASDKITASKINQESSLGSKEKDRKMSPYFKKMIKEYNPKYKRDKSKNKFDKLKAEVEDKFEKEHTFKPNINYDKVFSAVDKNNESKEELYRRLSTPKIIELNKRLKEKEVVEKQKLTEECTFKPSIKVNSIVDEDTSKERVENRLYKLAEQMKEKREKLKREYQDNEVKNYPFAPNIDTNSKQLLLKYERKKPLHERYEDIIHNKNENLQHMRNNIEKREKSLYKPEINSKSKEILMRRSDRSFSGEMSIHERLYREGVNKKIKNTSFMDHENDECTFAPNLYYSTTQPGGNIDDFLERQKIYDEIKKDRLERKLSKSIEMNQYTFSPQINLTSDILMKADHDRANEDLKDKVDRLYKNDFEKQQQRKDQLNKLYYAQFDFKPKINEISKFIGRDPTIEELHAKRESSKVRQFKQKDESEGCTFKPYTNKEKFEYIQSNYKLDENISKRIQSEVKFKNEKVEEIKAHMDMREMQECKFQPEIRKDLPNYEVKEPIMIKGFAKYIDQMEKARKAKRDKEEREKEVFISGENWSRDNLITIPKPFNLSYQKINKSKKEEIKRKNIENELKECTFKPQTNESKNKEIINMILKN